MNADGILKKIGAEKMVELKRMEELKKRITELEKEVKRKEDRLNEAIEKNQKLTVALEEIYIKLGIRCSIGKGIF